MENDEAKNIVQRGTLKNSVESDYELHKNNPAPAPTVNEPDNKGAGQTMKWLIPIVVLLLLVVWFFFFKDNAKP